MIDDDDPKTPSNKQIEDFMREIDPGVAFFIRHLPPPDVGDCEETALVIRADQAIIDGLPADEDFEIEWELRGVMPLIPVGEETVPVPTLLIRLGGRLYDFMIDPYDGYQQEVQRRYKLLAEQDHLMIYFYDPEYKAGYMIDNRVKPFFTQMVAALGNIKPPSVFTYQIAVMMWTAMIGAPANAWDGIGKLAKAPPEAKKDKMIAAADYQGDDEAKPSPKPHEQFAAAFDPKAKGGGVYGEIIDDRPVFSKN